MAEKYFNMEKVTVKGFCNFCKNNAPLIICVSITMVFTYGIRLFWHSIGIDTSAHMAYRETDHIWSMQIGRFGLVLLSQIFHVIGFNPFTAFYIAFCLFWFAAIFWCYILSIFSGDTGRNNKLIPFALVFMTMPVWAEQFYFLHQAAQVALIVTLCPYIIYLLYKGFLDNEKSKIICAFVLLVFIISVYQTVILLFCCGLFACFLLLQGRTDYKPKIYRNLCIKLFVTLLVSFAFYFFIDRVIISSVFNITRDSYLDDMIKWGQRPAGENIVSIFLFIYVIIGRIPFLHNAAGLFLANYAGSASVEAYSNLSKVFGNVLLLPVTVLFIISIVMIIRTAVPQGKRLLYLLAGIGIPISIIFPAVVGGNVPPIRSLLVLPFAFAFMLFFLIKTYKKKAAIVAICFALLMAGYQAQTSAQLFYSDQMRFNEDVRVAYELNALIIREQPATMNLPVVLVGRYIVPERFRANFLRGEMMTHSVFSAGDNAVHSTNVGLGFMRTLGINFDAPNNRHQFNQAVTAAKMMPVFPDPGSVRRAGDIIVVRLSEVLY